MSSPVPMNFGIVRALVENTETVLYLELGVQAVSQPRVYCVPQPVSSGFVVYVPHALVCTLLK